MANLKLTPTQNQNQAGYSGYGSLLTVSEDKGIDTSFPGTLMGALMGINAINIRTNVIPSYHMRSLGRFQSFSPGLRDGGEVSAAVNWLPGMNDTQGRGTGTWSLLRQATLESNALTRLRIFAPDPDLHMVTTEGFLTQLGPLSYQPEAIMSGQVGWKIVGSPDIITPIVYRWSGYSLNTAVSGNAAPREKWVSGGVSTSAFTGGMRNLNDIVATESTTGRHGTLTLITAGGSSDSGSAAAGILVGSGYVNSLSGVTLDVKRYDTQSAATITATAYADTNYDGLDAFADASTQNINVLASQDELIDIRLKFDPGTVSGESQLRARLYVPGEYELWTDYDIRSRSGSFNNFGESELQIGPPVFSSGTSADDIAYAERKRFFDKLAALGNPDVFLAIYGAAEL